jgi:hypothetical protein
MFSEMAKSKKNRNKPKLNLTVREEQRNKLEQMASLSRMPFIWFLMFISFDQCGITGCIKFPFVWHAPFMSIYGAGHEQVLRRSFLAYKSSCFQPA